MTIVQLFGEREVDGVIDCEPMPGVRFHIAFVVGVGNCPHQHRLEQKAVECGRRMRNYLDFQEARAASGRHVAADGTEYITIVRLGPGPRPMRRPW